ncbi:MAG: gamma-glutamylcyclotransferase [Myxococcota bacterium]
MWIFGYGSLMWRPGFPYRRAEVAVLTGWERRLDQGSPDHRGTPEQPGRVATLVPNAAAESTGIAFSLHDVGRDEILAALDHRERGGYTREHVRVALRDGTTVDAVTWVAALRNPWYLGPTTSQRMAEVIRVARGESGSNVEYVLRLAETLQAQGVEDSHVLEVARLLA